ncbi:MAG: GNAT family N-acetyltransferase [Planctomycetota bacterium]|jgi:CBS domain-containing protein
MGIDLSETSIRKFPHAFINKRGEPILIKPLDEKRHNDLVEMYLAFRPRNSFSGLPPVKDEACMAWVKGMIATGINLIALSFEEGIVGHAALFPVDKDTCEYMSVVSPPCQNIGIGSELTTCAIQLADELGFEKVSLHVEAKNHIARHVYEKSGFQYGSSGMTDELDMSLDLRRYRSTTYAAVRDIMNRRVLAVRPETPCKVALRIFLEDRVATLPVVDEDNRLVGIVSETELLIEANIHKKVSEILTREVVTVHEGCTIAKAISLFRSRKLRSIPVVNGRMELVGVLGRKEILAHYRENL